MGEEDEIAKSPHRAASRRIEVNRSPRSDRHFRVRAGIVNSLDLDIYSFGTSSLGHHANSTVYDWVRTRCASEEINVAVATIADSEHVSSQLLCSLSE